MCASRQFGYLESMRYENVGTYLEVHCRKLLGRRPKVEYFGANVVFLAAGQQPMESNGTCEKWDARGSSCWCHWTGFGVSGNGTQECLYDRMNVSTGT